MKIRNIKDIEEFNLRLMEVNIPENVQIHVNIPTPLFDDLIIDGIGKAIDIDTILYRTSTGNLIIIDRDYNDEEDISLKNFKQNDQ